MGDFGIRRALVSFLSPTRMFVPRWSAATLLLMSGCVAIPVGGGGEPPFGDDVTAQIEVGVTTRSEISSLFAGPALKLTPSRFENDRLWVYTASRESMSWLVCVFAPTAGYLGPLPCLPASGERDYFLSIAFDDADIVSDIDASSVLWGDCSGRICAGGGIVSMLASDERDQAAKATRLDSDECMILLYADLPSEIAEGGVAAWLNDVPSGALINSRGYLRWIVSSGTHAVSTRYFLALRRTIEIQCNGGEFFFLRYHVPSSRDPIFDFKLVSDAEGRSAISRRLLVLDRLRDPAQ